MLLQRLLPPAWQTGVRSGGTVYCTLVLYSVRGAVEIVQVGAVKCRELLVTLPDKRLNGRTHHAGARVAIASAACEKLCRGDRKGPGPPLKASRVANSS